MRFSKKTAHRIIISLAMVVPIAYLLGATIGALVGSHNSDVYAEDIQYDVVHHIQVKQLVDVYTEDYTVQLSSTNQTMLEPTLTTYESLVEGHFYVVRATMETDQTINGWFRVRYPFITPYDTNGSLIGYSSTLSYFDRLRFQNRSVSTAPLVTYSFYDVQFIDLSYSFPDLTFEEARTLYNTYLSDVVFPKGVTDFSYTETKTGNGVEYLSSSLFPRGNFVEMIGENAISANPKGFAPFGAMLRYLDFNALHASDTQIGLMFYGMVYWMLHVVFADLVYHVLVFMPNLIMAVFNWFGHGLDDDSGKD